MLRPITLLILLFYNQFNCLAQSQIKSEIQWLKFVNTECELEIPVSKTNYRPIAVPYEESLVAQILSTVNVYDFLEYRGANDEFFCSIKLSAFEEELSTEGISTKLLQEVKSQLEGIEGKELIYESIEPIQNEKRIYLEYKGMKETLTYILWISRKRIISIRLTDIDPDKASTNHFLETFKVYE